MCGITGYFGTGNQEILKRMNDMLRHRGPDDEGFWIGERVGLAQRRLSIIDLSPTGHQPMSNEDGSVWITFNGEIYNYQDLKPGLENRHKFRGSSDTEVIIHLYEEIGERVFENIDGMFAIALFDRRKNQIILARDRMGKKPLYWTIMDSALIFGSELKALTAHPAFRKELDMDSLNKYLQYEYIPTPHTIFKNVYKLEPGTCLSYNGRKAVKRKFWDIEFGKENIESGIMNYESEKEYSDAAIQNSRFKIQDSPAFSAAIQTLDRTMNNAVKRRLMSDVPLGVFLSGGIDSSTVAYYAQKNSAQKIKTFCIGFTEDSFDESQYARQVAAHLGTDHQEKILSARESLDIISQLPEILDEPMADASILPTYLLSKFTREQVTVALAGDGGDELFCGYDTFVAQRWADIYEKFPDLLQNLIFKISNQLPTSFKNISLDFKLKKFTSGFNIDKKYRHHHWLGAFDQTQRSQLFTAQAWDQLGRQSVFEDIDGYLENLSLRNHFQANYYDQLIYLYLRTYLMDDIMVKADRASMAASLEARAPFLDTAVVDLANSMPLDYKLRGRQTKYILKELMRPRLPHGIVDRRKKGFGIPLAHWLSADLKPLCEAMFNETKIIEQGLFNYVYIRRLLDDHYTRRADNRKLIWTLLVFQLWREKWM